MRKFNLFTYFPQLLSMPNQANTARNGSQNKEVYMSMKKEQTAVQPVALY